MVAIKVLNDNSLKGILKNKKMKILRINKTSN